MSDGFPSIKGRLPPRLALCLFCHRHVLPETELCPHCGCNLREARAKHEAAVRKWKAGMQKLEQVLARIGPAPSPRG
jgi:hypothetical protein